MHSKTLLPYLIPLYATTSSALILTFFSNKKVQGTKDNPSIGCGGTSHQVITGHGDCSTEQFDTQNRPLCLQVKSTGEVDEALDFVWFSSDDCNPESMMNHGNHKNETPFDITGYKSWQVWNIMSEDDKIKCTSG
ncbi:hypothetical protein PG989_012631 [Apiospora arundinis]|uniref:Secreted protein n=1 Tax=Apiospora arundinis TaxID=335852 RepID=A0ABR2IHR7_9PEZI